MSSSLKNNKSSNTHECISFVQLPEKSVSFSPKISNWNVILSITNNTASISLLKDPQKLQLITPIGQFLFL